MKTLRARLQQAAKASGINQLIVERDYAQSYVENYRFSEDLDFSAIGCPRGRALEQAVRAATVAAEKAARQLAPLTFTVERYQERDRHPGGQDAFVIRVQFPWQRQPMVPIKVEITHDEPVLLEAPRCPVRHGYEESIRVDARTYCLEEICAEKLRSARQTHAKLMARGWARPRARDFYDLWHLVREPEGRIDWNCVASILHAKCAHRAVAIGTVADVFEEQLLEEVRATWERTLGPFVRNLPPVQTVLAETRARLETLLRL